MNVLSTDRVQPVMKLAFLILAATINLVFAGDETQTNRTKPFDLWSIPPATSTRQAGIVSGDLGWNWTPWAVTNLSVTNFTTGKMPLEGKRSWSPSPPSLKPGLYRTSPYPLLVLVPGQQSDNGWYSGKGTGKTGTLLVLTPGLKFTPYSFAEK